MILFDALIQGSDSTLFLCFAGLVSVCAVLFVMPFLYRRLNAHEQRKKSARKWLRLFRKGSVACDIKERFSSVRSVDYFLFEYILLECFKERGYAVKYTPCTRDGGIDGEVLINDCWVAIQAKRYNGRISLADVKSLSRVVLRSQRFKKGIFIHSGISSKNIFSFIRGNAHIEMISGSDRLMSFLDGHAITLFSNLDKTNLT